MHFMTGDAGKFAATKTRRLLRPIVFTPRDADHAVAPEAILKKIRFGLANEILLFGVIGCIRLHDEALHEIVRPRAKTGAANSP